MSATAPTPSDAVSSPKTPNSPVRQTAMLPWWIACALVALTWGLELYALWSHPYVPLIDLPNHMARHYLESVWLRGGELPPFYAVEWRPLPNLGADFVIPVLMLAFRPEIACKVFLTLSVLLYWLGPALFLMECLDRKPQALAASLLLLPWTFTDQFFWGFLNYYSAVGLAFLVLAHHLRLSKRERVPVGGLLLHAALVVLLYFWHLAPWVLYCIIVGCRVAADLFRGPDDFWARLVRAVRALAPLVPSVLLFTVYFLGNHSVNPDSGWDWGGWGRKLLGPLRIFAGYDPRIDLPACLLWAAAVVVTFAAPRFKDLSRGWIPLALTVLAALYLLLPFQLGSTSDADTRVPPVLFVLALAAVGAAPLRRPRLGAVLLAACLLLRFGSILHAWDGLCGRLDAEARSFAVFRPGDRVLPVVLLPKRTKNYPEYHFAAWAAPDRGVFLPTLFTLPDQQPLRIVPPFAFAAGLPKGCDGPDACTLREAPLRDKYDYIWLYNPAGKAVRAPASFSRVFSEGALTVWRVPHDRPLTRPDISPSAPAARVSSGGAARSIVPAPAAPCAPAPP